MSELASDSMTRAEPASGSTTSAEVLVQPQVFNFVDFDAERIGGVARTLLGQVGVEVPLRLEIDEGTPLGRAWLTSLEPLVLAVESGAFEDPKRPRQLSDRSIVDTLGRLLFRVKDRLDPAFGEVPADEDLDLAQSVAWDSYAVGRIARLGYPAQRQRRLYHFRNRHGFSDTADAAFARLWEGEGLTWADVQAVCDETAANRTVA
ncbi:MAG: hypothetical protein H0U89_01065 [Acidimicrobiia bacterium]|nr:hypothetical protein [Acidimicrobiia bacterium]